MPKITNDSLAQDALYSCTHKATVSVKWLMALLDRPYDIPLDIHSHSVALLHRLQTITN